MSKPRVLLVDAFNYFYSQFQTNQAVDENGEPIGGFIGLVDHIQRLVYKFKPQRVVVIFDGPDAGMRRRKIFSEYKGRRAKKKRYATVSMGGRGKEVKVDNERKQLEYAFDFLRQLPITLVVVPFYEADDIIAHLTIKNRENESIICSSDKDFIQLCSDDVSIWSWGKKTLFTPDTVVEHYGVKPQNFAYFRSVVGDASDKLEGVKGVGEKTLMRILPQLDEKTYDNFEHFWDEVQSISEQQLREQTDKRQEKKVANALHKLQQSEKQVRLMYKLMQLTRSNIKLKAIEQLRQQLDEQVTKPFNTITFKMYCMRRNLQQHIKHFDYWVKPFVTLKKPIEIDA